MTNQLAMKDLSRPLFKAITPINKVLVPLLDSKFYKADEQSDDTHILKEHCIG